MVLTLGESECRALVKAVSKYWATAKAHDLETVQKPRVRYDATSRVGLANCRSVEREAPTHAFSVDSQARKADGDCKVVAVGRRLWRLNDMGVGPMG